MANDTLCVTLRLKTIDHLFAEPDLSPFDPYYAPYSFAAGIDYLIGEMQRRPRARRTELTVLLPPDQIAADPGLEARTREAIRALRGGMGHLRSSNPTSRRDQGASGPGCRRALFRRCQPLLPLVWPDRVGVRHIRALARRRSRGAFGGLVGGGLVATRPIAARELAASPR